MAIVSAYTIIRSLALFHLTLAVFLLRDPKAIADQNVVFILGESMQLPTPRDFYKASPTTAFIALLFAFLGLSDLTAMSLPEEAGDLYWGTQTPVRLLFNAGDHLKNSVVFTWGFLEMVAWFWVFVTIRDERRQRTMKLLEKRRAEADRL